MVGTLQAALHAASEEEAEEWLAVEIRLKGKSKALHKACFHLNVFYCFILLFQARLSTDLSFPIQKPGCHFCLRGRRGGKGIT